MRIERDDLLGVNLFGWQGEQGYAETKRLIAYLMCSAWDFRVKWREKQGVRLEAGLKGGYKELHLSDNGGEINVEWVNDHAGMRSIPTTWWGLPLNAETLLYRIVSHLDGEPIDYDRREKALNLTLEELGVTS